MCLPPPSRSLAIPFIGNVIIKLWEGALTIGAKKTIQIMLEYIDIRYGGLSRNSLFLTIRSKLCKIIMQYTYWASQGTSDWLANTMLCVLRNARIPLFLCRESNHIFTVWQHIWYYYWWWYASTKRRVVIGYFRNG